MNVQMLGAIGTDPKGVFIEQIMSHANISTNGLQRLSSHRTSCTVINVRPNGDRPCLHALGASDHLELSKADMDGIVEDMNEYANGIKEGMAVLHIGGTGLQQGCPQEQTVLSLLRRIRQEEHDNAARSPMIVTMDLIAPHSGMLDLLTEMLPMVDYFMPSIEEAEGISNLSGPQLSGSFFLNLGVRNAVIVKSGSLGSHYLPQLSNASASQTKETMHHIPICSDVTVVDTTGAGDAYCAGFVTAKSRGLDDLMACRVGTATAGLCCTGLGSDAGNTSWESTVKFMEEHLSS